MAADENEFGRALIAKWIDFEREPQGRPDPNYPDGIDIDVSAGKRPACRIELKHPTPRCGMWQVKCQLCGMSVSLTTAGRADDPKSLVVPCNMETFTK